MTILYICSTGFNVLLQSAIIMLYRMYAVTRKCLMILYVCHHYHVLSYMRKHIMLYRRFFTDCYN